MLIILTVDVSDEWVVLTLHSSDLVELASVLLLVQLRVSQAEVALLARTAWLIVVLGSAEGEVRADQAASESWLSVRIHILSLVAASRCLGSLGSIGVVFPSPSLAVLLILCCVSLQVPSSIHHGSKVHVIINAS
jgi:hypothetical protein